MSLDPRTAALCGIPAALNPERRGGLPVVRIVKPITGEKLNFAAALAEIVGAIDIAARKRRQTQVEARIREEAMTRLVDLVDTGPADQLVAFFSQDDEEAAK